MQETFLEKEAELTQKEQKFETERFRFEETEQQLKDKLSSASTEAGDSSRANEKLRRELEEKMSSMTSLHEEERDQKNETITELEQKLRETEETLKSARSRWDKESAIQKQKQDFLEVQLKELRN